MKLAHKSKKNTFLNNILHNKLGLKGDVIINDMSEINLNYPFLQTFEKLP